MTSNWRQNGGDKNWVKMATNGDKMAIKMAIKIMGSKWRQNGDKMSTKWR